MSTKLSSYLTELGFRQLELVSDAISYNKTNGGEYIIIKENNRIYRFDENSTEIVDDINILNTLDGGDTRWVTIGGSSTFLTRVEHVFNIEGNEIPLDTPINALTDILYVNVNNAQLLSNHYRLNATKDAIVLNQTFKNGVKAEAVICMGDLSAIIEGNANKDLTNTGYLTDVILSAPNDVIEINDNILTVKAGLKVLIPTGRDFDGKCQSLEYITPLDTEVNMIGDIEKVDVFIYSNGSIINIASGNVYRQDNTPVNMLDNVEYMWFSTNTNLWNKYHRYQNESSEWVGGTWEMQECINIGQLDIQAITGIILSTNIDKPLRVAHADDVVNTQLNNVKITRTGRELSLGVHYISIDKDTDFILPLPIPGIYNQIKVMVDLTGDFNINLGDCAFYGGEVPVLNTGGIYHIYYDFNPLSNRWVCGTMQEIERTF